MPRPYTPGVLIGRDRERQAIERLVAGARIGQAGVLVIAGEPGVGKTALLDHAAGCAIGMGALRAAGSEPEREIPFGALHQVLRPALDKLDLIPAPQARALSAALALRPGSPGDRFAVGAATLSLLCRFAEEHPVAILLDDLHLFDRPSADALAFAARRLVADPIVLLATSRTPEPALPELALSGIDLTAAGVLIAHHAPAAVSPELVARLHRATAGNPLALIELAAGLDRLERTSPVAPLPVPATLANRFATRARALGSAGLDALAVAAVVGNDLRMVASACRLLDLDVGALAEAENAGLIRIVDGRVDFRHPLVRAAVYGDTLPERRRSIHRAVAVALGPDEPDRHAWHLAEAALGPDASVADLLVAAAKRAHERSAHGVAAAAYERAARLCPDARRHAVLCVSAAESAWLAGSGPRAMALLDEAGELSGVDARLRALELRGAIAARTGSLAEARDTFRAAAAEAPDVDSRVVLLADAINASFYLSDTGTGVHLAVEIEGLLERVVAPRMRAVGQIAAGAARILANRGGSELIRAGVELLAATDDVGTDPRRLPWLMVGPLFLRDSGTPAAFRRAVHEARAEVAVGALPHLLFHLARDEATTNQWTRAEATYDEAIRLALETGQDTELAMSLAGLAWLQARLGRAKDCRRLVAEALPICRHQDIHAGRIWLLFALGELELSLGNPREALVHLDELDALLGSLQVTDPDLSPTPERTDALARLGNRDSALRIALDFHAAAVSKGQPWAMARAERTLGMLSDDTLVDTHFQASLGFHADTLDVFETARTQLAYGARLRRARRRVDARPHLRAALTTFDELRATPWADLAATELAATGEPIRRREPTGIHTLTPQELQVSLLLAEGKTIREAAAALFLSPKTVEYHLRKVYLKLGIRSRTELAALI